MPRLIQGVPKYRKHRASGQAVATINGRDHYLGPHGTKASKVEYDRLITEWLSSGRSSAYGAPAAEVTVVEIVADYLNHARSYYGSGPKSEYHRMVRVARPLRQLYGKTAAAEFGPLQLKAIRQQFIDDGCSRLIVNAMTQRVVRIFRWAAGEGRLSSLVPQALAMVAGLRRAKNWKVGAA